MIVSFPVHSELGIADNVWQNTSATIANTLDSLGYEFIPCSVLDGLRASTRPMVQLSPDPFNLWAKNLLLLKID